MKSKKILVTGGSGMLGQNLQKIMPEASYVGSSNYDLTKRSEVSRMYSEFRPHTVIHLAAIVGGIEDNIRRPAEYFEDNLLMNTFLVESARRYNVERFIGMLSVCAYPDIAKSYPLKEDQLHEGPPQQTNFGYGYAKRCMAVQIDQSNKQYEIKYSYLIPSNLYGVYDKYQDDRSHFVAALIKKIHEAKRNRSDKIVLFGNGTPLRQFMIASDLAKVIKYCIDNDITDSFNVAPDEVYTIKEIAKIALRVCGSERLKIEWDESKPNGQMNKTASNGKMKTIMPDFKFTPLEQGIRETYNHFRSQFL